MAIRPKIDDPELEKQIRDRAKAFGGHPIDVIRKALKEQFERDGGPRVVARSEHMIALWDRLHGAVQNGGRVWLQAEDGGKYEEINIEKVGR